MEEKMICVPLDEYTDMAVMFGRVKALEEYVKVQNYTISREDIAALLGFELPKEGDNE